MAAKLLVFEENTEPAVKLCGKVLRQILWRRVLFQYSLALTFWFSTSVFKFFKNKFNFQHMYELRPIVVTTGARLAVVANRIYFSLKEL